MKREETLLFAKGNGSVNYGRPSIPQRGTTRDQPRRRDPVSLATKLKTATKKDMTPLQWQKLARDIICADKEYKEKLSPEKIGKDVFDEFFRCCVYQEAKDILREYLSDGDVVYTPTIRAGSSI